MTLDKIVREETIWGKPKKIGDRYDTESGSWFNDPIEAYKLHQRKIDDAIEEKRKLELEKRYEK